MKIKQEYPFDTIGFFDVSGNLLFDGKLDKKGIFMLPFSMLNLPNCTAVANTVEPFYAEFSPISCFDKDEHFTETIKGKIYSSTNQKCQAYLVLTGVNNACFAVQVALIKE
jgi:hypothetical protein